MATAEQIKAVQDAYFAINRSTLNSTVAASVADAIAQGTTSLDLYIAAQIQATASTTGAAVAISSFITGVAPTSDKLTALKAEADKQVASYAALKVGNPALGAFEAFGRSFATDADTTAAFNTKYGSLSGADFINAVYFQVYGRAPSADAFANLSGQLTYFNTILANVPNAALAAKGAVLGQIVGYAFISDASANSTLDNAVASFLTSAAKGDSSVFGKALPTPSEVGTTYTLTVANPALNGGTGKADDFSKGGTNAGDVFNAQLAGSLETGDVLNGLGGNDVLNANLAAGVALPQITSIETLNLTSQVGGAGLDLTQSSGVTDIKVQNLAIAGAGVAVQGIASDTVKLAVSNVGDTAVNTSAVAFTFQNAALAGATNAIDLTLNAVGTATGTAAGTAPTVTIQGGVGSTSGAETVNLHATGNATLANLVVQTAAGGVAALTKLNIDGSGNVAIGNVATGAGLDFVGGAGTGEIDASKATGNVNITLQSVGNNDAVKFTGGSGNDTIAFNGSLNALDSVDGGTGRDTVQADLFASVVNAASVIKNVEIVNIATAAVTGNLDASKITGLDTITFGNGVTAANTATINNAGANFTVGFGNGGNAGAVIVNETNATLGSNTTDVLNINLGTAAGGGTAQNFGTVSAPGVETFAIRTQGNAVVSNQGFDQVTITPDASTKAITVAGNEYLTVTAAGGAVQSFDASASTGGVDTSAVAFANGGAVIKGSATPSTALGFANAGVNYVNNLVGGTGNDTITGGAGNDRLDGGAGTGSDSLTGGGGRDAFVLGANGNAANLQNPVVDTITDFQLGANGDVLDFTNVPGTPVLNGDVSTVLVSSLTGALPTGGQNGQAEIIVLDSSVAALTAANAQALNNKLFNLGGSGTYGNVIVVYSDSATGNVRVATATVTGGDISNVVDLAVLTGVTTAQFAANFAGGAVGAGYTGNLLGTGLSAPGVTFTANKAPFSTAIAADSVEGTVTAAGNDIINATAAQASNGGTVINGLNGTDTLNITDNATGANLAAAAITNIEVLNFLAGSTTAVTAPNVAGLQINSLNPDGATDIFQLGNVAQTFTGSTDVDDVSLGANGQTVSLGAGADIIRNGAFTTGTIDGGAGTDTIAVPGGASNISGLTLTAVEQIDFGGVNTNVTATAAQANTLIVTGAGANTQQYTISDGGAVTTKVDIEVYNLSTTGNAVTLGAAGVTVNGTGAGNDSVATSAANLVNTSLLLGGGTDSVTVNNQVNVGALTTLAAASVTGALLTGVEVLTLSGGTTGGSLVLSDGLTTVTLGAASDVTLGAGNTTVTGSGAVDRVVFTGGDVVTGNGGADTFALTTGAVTTSAGNRIVDFLNGTDKIELDLNAGTVSTTADLTTIAANTVDIVQSALTASQITTQVTAGASQNSFALIFNSTTGKGEIWFDTNWANTGNRIQVATLDNVDSLVKVTGFSAADFTLI